MESINLSKQIAELTLEKMASDVIVLDLKGIASFTDYFIICSADSTTQVKAISDHVIEQMKEKGIRVWQTEGSEGLNWVILDYVDVVVHVFLKNIRSFYNLEKMWGDAKIEKIEETIKIKTKAKTKVKSMPKTKRQTIKRRSNAKIS